MKVTTLESGSKGCDTVTILTGEQAQKLRYAGMCFVGRYVTSLDPFELGAILATGLAVTFITYAKSFDPSDEIAALKKLQIPQGVVVWLDVEDTTTYDPDVLKQKINTWAKAIKAAGYIPGMYVGAGVPFTSSELYALAVERYWHSCSRVVDSHNNAAEPYCGWCMYQCTCEVARGTVVVDVDFVYQDYKGRGVPMVTL